MTAPASERAPRGGLGRLVAGAIAYLFVAPVGLVVLPVAALTAASRSRETRALVAGVVGAGIAAWWLLTPGGLPDQTARAAAVVGTAAFLLMSMLTRWTVTHRALAGVTAAGITVAGGYLAFGYSWDRLHWWVEHRTTVALRFLLSGLWQTARRQGEDGTLGGPQATLLNQLEAGFDDVIRIMADLFPATLALQMLAGFALAAAIYYRVAGTPVGRPPQPFRFFRFSEHLGWAVALPLLILLLPRLGSFKLFAGNVLAVSATLYAVRGVAVAAFGLLVLRAGVLLYVATALAVFLLLPFAPGAALVLGVVDSGLDLRRRWATPPSTG